MGKCYAREMRSFGKISHLKLRSTPRQIPDYSIKELLLELEVAMTAVLEYSPIIGWQVSWREDMIVVFIPGNIGWQVSWGGDIIEACIPGISACLLVLIVIFHLPRLLIRSTSLSSRSTTSCGGALCRSQAPHSGTSRILLTDAYTQISVD